MQLKVPGLKYVDKPCTGLETGCATPGGGVCLSGLFVSQSTSVKGM